MADTKIKMILGMPFLILNNANIRFAEKDFVGTIYSTSKVLPITWKIEIIKQR